MKKYLLILLLGMIGRNVSVAQPRAFEAKVVYQKTQQAVAQIELPYSSDIVEDALKDYTSKRGLKGASSRGYVLYRGARLDDNSTDLNDLHLKSERKGREKNITIVTLLVANPSEDPAHNTTGTLLNAEKAKAFLDHLVPTVEAYSLEADIKDQEDVVKKSQKKYNGLLDDRADLEKKMRYAQDDLEQNKKDQAQQADQIKSSLQNDPEGLKKARRKMNNLIDDQSSLEKKIRKYQVDEDQNKKDQETWKADLQKQQQSLDSMKARRKVDKA